MSLEALIADAKRLSKKTVKRTRTSREAPGEAFYRTKEELRQMKLDACAPVSVHLRVTYQKCECGAALQSVNTYPLVKRVSPILTWFEAIKSQDPGTLSQYNELPRFIETRYVDVPWCEDCFANATYIEATDE